ncbi:hypothetical protein [Legionella maceachernii]|uniref:Uncharacterized protein n=1 Tax=Legionella maceachernii TaxID=466 RepID=A0A0W0WEN9_9GAMM|nr:hypothetical protein [Legionella maceachernii]KTD30470.1 hypothetical protein Lmac_0654 [Legionella maceachernii]SJZ68051.1 hypothetical protein SAMN02745128_00758 [Legionella maceachernii]SUP02111.1 Uncharacterised protein [Legionella maceachernii]
MKNSLKSSYAFWIKESYLKEDKRLYKAEAKVMLAGLKKDIHFDELLTLVESTLNKIPKGVEFFSKGDSFATKLKEWHVDLLQRQQDYKQFDLSNLNSEAVADEVKPLLNLLKTIIEDPSFLMHTRAQTILKTISKLEQLQKTLSYIAQLPEAILSPEAQKKSYSTAHKGTMQLYDNHQATYLESNSLSLMANGLLVNCLEVYQDLQQEEPKTKKCLIM